MTRRPLVRLALLAGTAAPLAAQPPAPSNTPCASNGTADVGDLPLVEVPADAPAPGPAPGGRAAPWLAQRSVALLITGDGDWAPIDRGIAAAVAQGGVPVVGLKVRAYLSRGAHGKRTPDDVTRDVERIARAYMAR